MKPASPAVLGFWPLCRQAKDRGPSRFDPLVIAPCARHEALANELYLLGASHDVTISPYLVEPGELATLDRQFLESVARDGLPLRGPPPTRRSGPSTSGPTTS